MQLTLELQAGLTQQYRSLRECVSAVVYGSASGAGPSNVAPALDMAPGDLGRKLAPRTSKGKRDGKRNLDIDDLVTIIEATGDYRPVLWLVEKFLPSDEQKQRAIDKQLAVLIPQLSALIAEKQTKPSKAGAGRR